MGDAVAFFVDRCLGSKLVPEALEAAGFTVVRWADHFTQEKELDDTAWLKLAAEHGWLVLTKDTSGQAKPVELLAIQDAGCAVFQLANAQMSGRVQAAVIASSAQRMLSFAKKHETPFIARIHRNGTVHMYRKSGDLHRHAARIRGEPGSDDSTS